MKKPHRKALILGLGGAVVLALAGAFMGQMTGRGIGDPVTPVAETPESSPQDAPRRVELLAGLDEAALKSGKYALVLEDFVTGSGPRLITDGASLAALQPSLWYLDEGAGATVAAAIAPGTMGLPPSRSIGALIEDGRVVKEFSCLPVSCQSWPETGAEQGSWGMGALRGQVPGAVPLEQLTSHYETYDSYLIAHKSIAADPTRWFATPRDEAVLPPDTGLRRIHIDLPSELVTLDDPAGTPPESDDVQTQSAALSAYAKAWIGDGPGEVVAVRISEPMPFWVLKDDALVSDTGGNRALPGIGWRDRSITIELPDARIEEVAARIDTGFAPPPDTLRLADEVHRAFVTWGLDTSCLPGCGAADVSRIMRASGYTVSPRPSWSITSWREIPAGEAE